MKKISGLLVLFWVLSGFSGAGQSYLEEVQACRLLEQGKPDEAVRLLEQKLKRYPRNFDCHLYLGLAMMLKGDMEAAGKELGKVEKEIEQISGAPAAMTADRTFADVDRMQGRSGLIFTASRRGVLKYGLGLFYKGNKDYKNAGRRFEEALKYDYPKAAAWKQLAVTECLLDDYKSAEKWLAALAEAGEVDERLDFLRGYIAWNLGREQDAAARFEALSPTLPAARRNLAVVLYNQGDYQGALDIWLGILEEQPRDADSLKNSGRAYYHLGEKEKGQAQFDTLGFKMKVEKYSPKTIPLLMVDFFTEPEFDFMCQDR